MEHTDHTDRPTLRELAAELGTTTYVLGEYDTTLSDGEVFGGERLSAEHAAVFREAWAIDVAVVDGLE